jgi:pimeloyl-ACP methyl ester carboxylesterase
MGHKPFLVLADHLTRKGIAVLRYDDRGTGKSTGSFAESTSKDFASDAAAGIAYLANHEKIDAKRIGLVGHSEGGLIGGMLAANNDQLAHVVLLAGPGVSGDEIIRTQTAALSEAAGMEADSADLQMVTEVLDALKSDASADEIATIAEKYLDDDDDDDEHDESGEDSAEVDSERDSADATSSESAANIAKRIAMRQFASPWFRYFVKYDPQADLAKVKCPVLAMNGAKDLQVLVDVNLPAIEKALQSAPAQGHQIERLEGLNHLFQTAETGLPAEYGKIEETMSPRALKLISDWILAH